MFTAQNVEDGRGLKIETIGESFQQPLSQSLSNDRQGSNRDPGNEVCVFKFRRAIFQIFSKLLRT